MNLDSKKLYNILRKKGLNHFYHANTVGTSKTFLRNNALLSREFIQSRNLYQTDQVSDDKDIRYGINDFIYLDANDLSAYFSRPNKYGPVLFRFDNSLLLDDKIPTVRITKSNPIHWKDKDKDVDRYYLDLEQFDEEYLSGNKLRDGRTMFMITTTNGILSLDKYFNYISVDNPYFWLPFNNSKIEYLEKIKEFLGQEINDQGIEKKIVNRFKVSYLRMRIQEPQKFQRFFTTVKL